MKRVVAVCTALLLLLLPVTTFADAETVDDVIRLLPSFSDTDLAALQEAVASEQDWRASAVLVEGPQDGDTAEEEYIEREPIWFGDSGDAVWALQQRLVELGFLKGEPDGNFGDASAQAVALFQRANDLEETGVADSMTQYILYSSGAVDKTAYDNRPVLTGEGWELAREFFYNEAAINRYYYICLVRNTSGYLADININVTFYDEAGNIIGVSHDRRPACENSQLTYWEFYNDTPFYRVNLEFMIEKDTWYQDGAQSAVELTCDNLGNKVIISAVNNGELPVESLEYNVLFLNESGRVVDKARGFLTDMDSELKPHATEMREEQSFNEYVDVIVTAHGCINKTAGN